jgi:hypothetical protein
MAVLCWAPYLLVDEEENLKVSVYQNMNMKMLFLSFDPDFGLKQGWPTQIGLCTTT